MNEDLEQRLVVEAQERDLDYHMYMNDGGSAIDLLQFAIPLLKKEKPLPERIRVDLIKYLESRLTAEKIDNPTDRAFLRWKKLFPRRASIWVKIRATLKGITETKARRELIEKIHQHGGHKIQSDEALKKMIQRARKKGQKF